MPIARERLLDGGVAHELLNRLRIDSGVDQQRGECVAALVEREWLERVWVASLPLRRLALVGLRPGALGTVGDGV